jgi:uncharacterized protein
MVKQIYSLLVMLILSFTIEANTSLTIAIDQDFNVISVNGKSYKSVFLATNSVVNLRNGVNKIAIEYEEVFDQYDEFELVKSDTFLISFYANNNKNYTLTYLKPANARAARVFAKNPIISIVDQTGALVRASSFFLGSKSEGFVNQQTRPSLIGQPAIRITSNDKNIKQQARKKNNAEASANAEERLEFWWQKATPQQRQSFLDKISKQ